MTRTTQAAVSIFVLCALMALMLALAPLGASAYAFGAAYMVSFGALLLAYRGIPEDMPWGITAAAIIIFGVVLRLAYIAFPPANDMARYIWEGFIQTGGFNPYALAPDSVELVPLRERFGPLWATVNHSDMTAIYPPLLELLFRACAGVSLSPYFFKAVLTGFDVAALCCLAWLLRLKAMPARRLFLYAANPLVVVFLAGEGHAESVQLFFLLAALCLFEKEHEGAGFFALGLAVMSKYFAILALPFLLTARNWKKSWLALAPLALYLPYADAGAGLFASLTAFGGQMHYNDSVAAVLRLLSGDAWLPLSLAGLAACLALVWLVVQERLKSLYLAFGCLLLFLGTLHPWYLALIAPFAALYPSWSWLWLMAGVAFIFPVVGTEYYTGVFQEVPWLKLGEYAPFYALLLYGLFREAHLDHGPAYLRPYSASVVIPTLNEEASIAGCLDNLAGRKAVSEVIVADGGSTDGTVTIARRRGAQVLRTPPGRGPQIRAGIGAATGDVVLVLHADCRLERGMVRRILRTLAERPHVAGGACGMRFEGGDRRLWLIAFLNNFRARFMGISFGDQAQFVRRQALEVMGGYPDLLLMEDVEFSLRLREAGEAAFLPQGVRASNRRWGRDGFSVSLLIVLRLFARYLIERRLGIGDGSASRYYESYYGRPTPGSGA